MTECGGEASTEFLEDELARTDFAGFICRASRFKGKKYSEAKEKKGVYLYVVKKKKYEQRRKSWSEGGKT